MCKQAPHRPIMIQGQRLIYGNLKRKTRKMIREREIVGNPDLESSRHVFYKSILLNITNFKIASKF